MRAAAATDGRGADLVVETIGASTFTRSLNAVAIAGTIFVVGFIGGMELSIPILPVNLKTLTIVGNNTGSTANLADTVRAVATAGIEPVIDRTFGFESALDGYRFLERARHFGKVVIDLDA
jgi:NADPH:quinone reductase-like Zn-dependent oxidoreductase